jgi:glycosyltransferase involved in cell wall biosynthesis
VKILYVTNYQGPAAVAQRGHRRNRTLGPSRKVEVFTRGLVGRGHDVEVLSAATVSEGSLRWYPGFDCREPGCGAARVRYLPGLDFPRLNLLVAGRLLKRHLEDADRPDVVFLYNLEWYFLEPTMAWAHRAGVPVVVEYEDDALLDVGTRLKGWHRRRGRRAIDLARSAVAGVVAVSPELGRQLGHPNTVVIPGLVDDDLLSIPRLIRPERAGPLRIVYAGGINHEKGPALLVEAIDRLGLPAELDVVGGGPDLQALREAAARSRQVVRVHGEVPRERLVELLAACDLAVNPRRMSQGMLGQIIPFKMVDYLGAGLPVVSSRLGEFPSAAKGCLLTYQADDPALLAAALTEAHARLDELRHEAVRARGWVAAEYSAEAAGRKLEVVFDMARGAKVATRSKPGQDSPHP